MHAFAVNCDSRFPRHFLRSVIEKMGNAESVWRGHVVASYQRTGSVVAGHGLARSIDKTRHCNPLRLAGRLIDSRRLRFYFAKVTGHAYFRIFELMAAIRSGHYGASNEIPAT